MRKRVFLGGFLWVLLLLNFVFSDETKKGTQETVASYRVDKAHTNIGFWVRHMVLSKVHGEFKDYDVVFKWDENNLGNASIEVHIRTASIDTDNERRDKHLKSSDFLAIESYPEIVFESTKIEHDEDGYVAHGTLTIRGVTKNISLPFTVIGHFVQPDGTTRMGVEASLKINRFDYNVSWDKKLDTGGLIAGEDVNIDIEAEFISENPGS
jgi:polyisoprenoid-binding protein YceI